MRKKTLTTLTFVGLALLIMGIAIITVSVLALIAATSTTSSCSLGTCCSSGSCYPSTVLFMSSFLIVGGSFTVIACILHIIAWIGTMVKQAKQRQWVWFGCALFFGCTTLILGWICTWIYLIAVREQPKQTKEPVALPYLQPYPVTQPNALYQPYQQQPLYTPPPPPPPL